MSRRDRQIARGLLALRLALWLFLLQWTIEKFVAPEKTAGIWSKFYLYDLPVEWSWMVAIPQLVIVLAFLAGYQRTIFYGLCFAMHFISTASTWQQLINPYQGINHLFAAAVPILVAFGGLFALRDLDLYSWDGRRS